MTVVHRNIEPIIKAKTAMGVRLATEHLLGASVAVAPIETGFLIGTAEASYSADGSQGQVSYDGPYAVIQHEDYTFKHDPGRRAGYLGDVAQEEAGTIHRLLQQALSL